MYRGVPIEQTCRSVSQFYLFPTSFVSSHRSYRQYRSLAILDATSRTSQMYSKIGTDWDKRASKRGTKKNEKPLGNVIWIPLFFGGNSIVCQIDTISRKLPLVSNSEAFEFSQVDSSYFRNCLHTADWLPFSK